MSRPKKEHFYLIVNLHNGDDGMTTERHETQAELQDAIAGYLSSAVGMHESDLLVIRGGELLTISINREPTIALTGGEPKRTRKTVPADGPDTEVTPKRKGGRPKGSKNKPKLPTNGAAGSSRDYESDDAADAGT